MGALTRLVLVVTVCLQGEVVNGVDAVPMVGVTPRLVWVTPGAARGTPVTDGRSLYVRTAGAEIVSLSLATGAIQWRARVASASGLVAGSRIVVAGDLVLAGDDRVEAFRRLDGSRAWRLDVGPGSGVGLYLGDAERGLVFAGSYSGHVWAIDATSGAMRWAARASPDPRTTVFVPVFDVDQVVATFTSFGAEAAGGVVAFDLSGQLRWRAWMPSPDRRGAVGACVAVAGLVVAAGRSGTIYAFDRLDGHLRWSIPPSSEEGREDFRPLAVSGGVLVAGSLRGEVIAYEMSTQRERWRRWPIDASVAFHVAADETDVYVPYVSGHVVALDVHDGQEQWRVGGSVEGFRWVPLVVGPFIYANGARGGVMAFRREESGR